MRLMFVFIIICFFVVIPVTFAFAAQSDLASQIVPCNGPDCNVCHLVQLAQNLINIGIFITIALSAMTFAYAGFLYLSSGGNPGQAAKARGIFTNVAIGLVLILGAWIGVVTLMKTVVDEGSLGGPWNAIGCTQTASFR